MDSPATPQDVARRWRPLSSDEELKAATLLLDAWQLIKLHNPTIETRLAATPPTLEAGLVVIVLCAMVTRVLRNPDGKIQEQIEDYRYQRDPASASGDLFVSDDELRLLAESSSTSNAFTITPYFNPEPTTFGGPVDVWPAP